MSRFTLRLSNNHHSLHPSPVVRPIDIKVCCCRNLPHYTPATLSTLHYLPPPRPPHGTRTRLRITRQDEVQIWGVAQFRAHFPIRSGLTSTSVRGSIQLDQHLPPHKMEPFLFLSLLATLISAAPERQRTIRQMFLLDDKKDLKMM